MKKYDDIINMTRPISKRRKMSNKDRAAQFAPFAALRGHEEAIKETARLTDKKITLDEQKKIEINRTLSFLSNHTAEENRVAITYFKADKKKDGGEYISSVETFIKIDEVNRVAVFEKEKKIKIDDIVDIKPIKKEPS